MLSRSSSCRGLILPTTSGSNNYLLYHSAVVKKRFFRHFEELTRQGVSGFFNHFSEMPLRVAEQLVGVVELDEAACVHHHHAVRVHDRVQTMRDSQYCAVGKSCSNCSLNELVRSATKNSIQFIISTNG